MANKSGITICDSNWQFKLEVTNCDRFEPLKHAFSKMDKSGLKVMERIQEVVGYGG